MDSISYMGVAFMKRRIMGGLLLSLFLLPAAVGAADGGNGILPAQKGSTMQFSSAFPLKVWPGNLNPPCISTMDSDG